jgi:DNA-3-methyladenine glycosylase
LPKLGRDFFEMPTLQVARELLGKILVYYDRVELSGRIVEVEAYIGMDDPACHARFGKTKRNNVMFGPGGFTYVYFVYGMYNMLNFVTEKEGFPAACLIRALEPVVGLDEMKKNRKMDNVANLTNGPGKLCMAFGLTTDHSGLDMCGDRIYVTDDSHKVEQVVSSPRIGIKDGLDKDWRFFIDGNKFVSKG